MDLALIAREGVFSTADAARAGLDANALRRLVRDGRCLRLTRGWFAVLDGGPLDGPERHRRTALALGRQYRRRAAVSHHSMLLLARVPTFGADLATVHLTSIVDPVCSGDTASDEGGARRNVTVRRRGVVIHEPLEGLRLDGPSPDQPAARVRVVPVAVAVVQAGLLSGAEAFLVPADASVRAGRTTCAELTDAVASFAGHTGIGPVRAALPSVEPRHESPGETRTAHVLRSLGFELEAQVEIAVEGRLYRPDFRIRGTRVLIEFDGALKYASGDGRVLFAEKQREDALRRCGWVVVRIVWSDLREPARLLGRIGAALAATA